MSNKEHRLLERYRRLIEISRDLASTLELDTLLNHIIRYAADITEAQAASILLYDPLIKQLYFQAATNMDPLLRGLAVPLDSLAGWIVTNRQPVRIADVTKDERHFDKVGRTMSLDTKNLLGVPLITKDKVIGVIEVINKPDGEFTETDEDLLTVISTQAAIAIENTRLFQEFDLVSEFVHELRTPLASLSTATYLLLRPDISQEQSHQLATNIHSETIRLNSMASEFLDVARLESGRVQFQKSTFPVRPMLDECRESVQVKADDEQVALEFSVPEDMPEVQGDRDKLKRVLLNLLNNAIKYNRPNGKVELSTCMEDGNWLIRVTDTGHGIPENAVQKVFEKFYRVNGMENKVAGTGLGLAICKEIVKGHGGRIDVKSRVGSGSSFLVTIPQVEKPDSITV